MSDGPVTYPVRTPHFDREVLRALLERGAAATIGADGVLLVLAIVAAEDRARYAGPVAVWNTALQQQIGARSPDTLERVRSRCVRAGWLSYTPGSRSRAATYFVVIPAALELPQICGGSLPEHPHGCGSSIIQHPQICGSSERTPREVPQSCGGSTANYRTDAAPSSPIHPTPKTDERVVHVVIKTSEEGRAAVAVRAVVDEDRPGPANSMFAQFWSAYPRHVAKRAAGKAFDKAVREMAITETNLTQILDALERQKRSPDWLKDQGRFVPHPATWLNGRRWEDEGGDDESAPDVLSFARPAADALAAAMFDPFEDAAHAQG